VTVKEMTTMRIRWAIAAVAALSLAFLTLHTDLPNPFRQLRAAMTAGAPAARLCSANAKAANLNFTLKDMNGKTVRLADFRGKVVLLDFWATWCAPCKVEIPWFEEFQAKYGTQGLQVVGVSVDDPADKLQAYARVMKMNYPVLVGLNHDDLQDTYGPMLGLPTSIMISRDAKVCSKHMGLDSKNKFEDEIKSLLNGSENL
jgi:cytochrome c biogenesis protein CcmG/thiol:disulfide interchange protein DsbE